MKITLFILLYVALFTALLIPQVICAEEIRNEVFLLERQDKLMAFSGVRNNWFEIDLHSGETVIQSMYDGNVAVVCTTERALGFSSITGRWAQRRLRIRESMVSISAKGDVATVVTNLRALGFSAKTGAWVESYFKLGD